MSPARVSGLGVISAALLFGCGTATSTPSAPGAPAASGASSATRAAPFAVWLHVTAPEPDGTLELMSSEGHVLRTLPGGELTGDGAHLVTTVPGAGVTHLQVLDARSGAVVDDRLLPVGFRIPKLGPSQKPVALSPGDRFAAVQDRLPGLEAGSVKTTRLAVVGLAAGGTTRVMTLQGDFSVDALSSDGTQLYLIETLRPDVGGVVQYRVRRVDVPNGALDPQVVVDKTDGQAAMAGEPLSRPAGGDPRWVLTLYGFSKNGPFVHGLGVDSRIAICVDLPKDPRGNDMEQLLWSLVRVPGSSRVLAVNAGTGQIVELEASSGAPTVIRTANLPLAAATPQRGVITTASAKRLVSTGAVFSPDGRTLYAVADQGILAVDTATLKATRTLAAGIRPSGLAISPDGHQLLAVEEDGATVDAVDTVGGAVTVISHGTADQVDAIVGPAAAG